MKSKLCKFALVLIPAALFAAGCGDSSPTDGAAARSTTESAAPADTKTTAVSSNESQAGHSHAGHTHAGHTHEAWWCEEHGVPEEVCGQCNAKLAAEFQRKGDWCREHDRPASQCFICHPEQAERYAAQYEAKYGTKPAKARL